MTGRVLVIGNSHLAALRAAEAEDGHTGTRFVMVGAKAPVLEELTVAGGALSGRTARATEAISAFTGQPRVDLSGLRALVITGPQLALARIMDIPLDMAWPDLRSIGPDPRLPSLRRLFVSGAAARAVAERKLRRSLALRLARRIGRASGLPVVVTSQPRTSAAVLDHPRVSGLGRLRRILDAGDQQGLSELFEGAAAKVTAEAGATYLPQPPGTIRDHVLTDLAFATGARRLKPDGMDRPQPPGDVLHANAAYGRLVLDQVRRALGAP